MITFHRRVFPRRNNWKLMPPCDVNYYNVINVNHIFFLDLASSHVRKIQILLIFSWVNDCRKQYQKSNTKWFTRSCSWICCCLVFKNKNLCCDGNFLCFVSIYLPRSRLMLVAYNKTNISCLLCLISKLLTLSNITFINFTSPRWILITSGE